MKNKYTKIVLLVLLSLLFSHSFVFAQVPQAINFQAIARDGSGNPMVNTNIQIRLSVIDSAQAGTIVYQELRALQTNAYGSFSFQIGVNPSFTTIGSFPAINWVTGNKHLKIDYDPTNTFTFNLTLGVIKFVTVPYAFTAETVAFIDATGAQDGDILIFNSSSGKFEPGQVNINETDPIFSSWDKDYTDLTNKPSLFDGTWSSLTGKPNFATVATSGSYSDLTDLPTIPTVPTNVSEFFNDVGYLTEYNEIDSIFTTWDKSTGISIVESQISDFGNYIENETDPRVPYGNQAGQMQYWNGSAWVTVAATENEGATLQMLGGVPTWTGGIPPPPSVTNPITGRTWMDRNLGALQVATSSSDSASYGNLYQWGRATDGHQIRTSQIILMQSITDSPGNSNFIINVNSPFDWRIPQNDNLWQGVNGINNPCPSGYRLPTIDEWQAEFATWNTGNSAGAFSSQLKLPMAGNRYYSGGELYYVNTFGYYWSSTVDGTNSKLVFITSNIVEINSWKRSYGFSVRCIKN